jgi:hypothetical protein
VAAAEIVRRSEFGANTFINELLEGITKTTERVGGRGVLVV